MKKILEFMSLTLVPILVLNVGLLLLLHCKQQSQIEEISDRPFCYKTQCTCSHKQP